MKPFVFDLVAARCMPSEEFRHLVAELEKAADALAECGQRLYGRAVPAAVLLGAAVGRATQRLDEAEAQPIEGGGVAAAARRQNGNVAP